MRSIVIARGVTDFPDNGKYHEATINPPVQYPHAELLGIDCEDNRVITWWRAWVDVPATQPLVPRVPTPASG